MEPKNSASLRFKVNSVEKKQLQPAKGARDLNPKQVEINHLIASKLSNVFKLWGYEEVSPPNIERLPTLMAGDAISNKDILKVVADEPLGLRPEMTTSIARAASTRLINRPRPLRLWANGTIFKNNAAIEGGTNIEENQQSGVELFGIKSINAEIELLSLLLESLKVLELKKELNPTLLVGHTELLNLILQNYTESKRKDIKSILINLNRIDIKKLDLDEKSKSEILNIYNCRGLPKNVIERLEAIYGEHEIFDKVTKLFKTIEPIAKEYNLRLQLDPTFTTNFDLYNGFVFQLICKSSTNNVVIARGGRYDKIVSIFSKEYENNAGVGFSYAIDKIRELINESQFIKSIEKRTLVAYKENSSFDKALAMQRKYHKNNSICLVELTDCASQEKAIKLLEKRNCNELEWIE